MSRFLLPLFQAALVAVLVVPDGARTSPPQATRGTVSQPGRRAPHPASSWAPLRTELRVPAYTAYLAPDPDGARFSRDRDVAPFTNPGSRLLWFGEFVNGGSVSAAVTVTAARGARVALRLAANGVTHDASITGTDSAMRVSFGSIGEVAPGYLRFELSAGSNAGAANLRVAALLLDGEPVSTAHFNLDARRNAASVHLRYPVDTSEVISGFYNEVTAVADPVTTYYMATGFARGYFGMQVNSATERRIIFSVWDSGEGGKANDRSTVAKEDQVQLLAKGDAVEASVFGNEGTGGHSHLVYPWKTGSAQRFFVTAKPESTHTDYSGYWFHPDKQQWQLIASFRAPRDGKGLRRLYSFSENFGGATGHLVRKALFGPQWIRLANGEWQELTTATFSHDVTGKENRLDRFMGVENGRFFLQHGGFEPGFTALGSAFTRPASGPPPLAGLPR